VPVRKFILLTFSAFLVARTASADVGALRDQLMSSDETTVAQALKEAESLSPKDRKMLVMSLIVPLNRNPESAQAAARALALIGKESEEALPELMEALRFDDPAVALAVGAALLKIGPDAVRPLIKALDDPNFVIRQRAAEILGAFGPEAKRAAPDLVELLRDNQTETAAEGALLKIGAPSVPALTDALRKSDPATRQTLIRLLAHFGPAASPALIQTLRKDDSSTVRVYAAGALAAIRPVAADAVPALIDAMRDPDDNARTAVVGALAQLGPEAKAAIGILIVASHRDSEELVKQTSLRALQNIGRATKASLPGLIDNLKADEGDIRRESVIAIGQADVAPGERIPLLALALKDGDPNVKMPAVEAAAELVKTNKDAVSLLRIASFDGDKKVRAAALDALGGATAGPDEAALVLDDVLKDPDPAIRNQCIQSLAHLGPAAVPVLLHEMSDSYTVLGENAEATILAMGPDAIPALQKAQTTNDAVLQKKIAAMIAQIQNAGQPEPPHPAKKKIHHPN